MILAPTACPKCGDQLTAPIPSRRAGLVVQTCRRNGCGHTIWSTTPTVVLPAAPANHDNLFHSTLGLASVRTALYRPERDLFKRCQSIMTAGHGAAG